MRTAGTVIAVALALLWSALVWGGYGLLVLSTGVVARNAGDVGVPPDIVGWAGVLDALLRDYGTGIAAVAWAVGILLILALRALFNLLVGGARDGAARPDVRHGGTPPEAARPPPAAAPSAPVPPRAPAESPVTRWGRGGRR